MSSSLGCAVSPPTPILAEPAPQELQALRVLSAATVGCRGVEVEAAWGEP